jgi:hypothetical protein
MYKQVRKNKENQNIYKDGTFWSEERQFTCAIGIPDVNMWILEHVIRRFNQTRMKPINSLKNTIIAFNLQIGKW